MIREEPRHRVAVADVRLHEHDARIRKGAFEAEQTSGVGQLVRDDNAVCRPGERVVYEVGADEACSTRDKERAYTAAPSGY
jgi:hypothetical protein